MPRKKKEPVPTVEPVASNAEPRVKTYAQLLADSLKAEENHERFRQNLKQQEREALRLLEEKHRSEQQKLLSESNTARELVNMAREELFGRLLEAGLADLIAPLHTGDCRDDYQSYRGDCPRCDLLQLQYSSDLHRAVFEYRI